MSDDDGLRTRWLQVNPAWWATLGMAPTDDVRSVKRAYAARLKTCRPEDDPQAFNRLREAYEAILSRLKNASKGAVDQSVGAPAAPLGEQPLPVQEAAAQARSTAHEAHTEKPAATVAPVAETPDPVDPPAPAAIGTPRWTTPAGARAAQPPEIRLATSTSTIVRPSPQQIARRILDEVRRHEGQWQAFASWLDDHEDLVSLDFKAATSHALLNAIAVNDAPCREAMEVLVQFFGWGDYTKAGVPPAARTLLAQVQQRVSETEFAAWLDSARNDKDAIARTLRAVRRRGDGKRAWMAASLLINRSRVVQSFKVATSTYGEAVLPVVLGDKAIKFWYRALAPVPNLLQMALTIPAAVVTAILVAMLLLLDINQLPMYASVSIWTMTLLAAGFFCTDWFGMAMRLWLWRCLPVIGRGLRALSRLPYLGKIPREAWGIIVLAVLALTGWLWPRALPDWPFYTAVLFMSLGAFRERRGIYGCAIATLGACVLFKLFFDNGKVPFLTLPATLWLGRWLHQRLARSFPRLRAAQESVILILGMIVGVICLGLAGWHIS